MKKTSKSTIAKKRTTKRRCPALTVHSWRQIPITDAAKDRIADRLIRWVSTNNNALTFSQFFKEEGLTPSRFYVWIQDHEALKEAHEYAKMCMGSRREVGGLTREFDASLVRSSMPLYCDQWKNLEEWRTTLKAKEEEQRAKTEVVVRMEPFPTSDLVPEKKEDRGNTQ